MSGSPPASPRWPSDNLPAKRWSSLGASRLLSAPLGFFWLLAAQALREPAYPLLNLHHDSLIKRWVRAIGIGNVPVLNLRSICKDALPVHAAHVDHQFSRLPILAQNRLRSQTFDRVPIFHKRLPRQCRHFAEWIDSRAAGDNHVGRNASRNRFRHGASAGVAHAHKEHLDFLPLSLLGFFFSHERLRGLSLRLRSSSERLSPSKENVDAPSNRPSIPDETSPQVYFPAAPTRACLHGSPAPKYPAQDSQ